jgi:hypothetical protein
LIPSDLLGHGDTTVLMQKEGEQGEKERECGEMERELCSSRKGKGASLECDSAARWRRWNEKGKEEEEHGKREKGLTAGRRVHSSAGSRRRGRGHCRERRLIGSNSSMGREGRRVFFSFSLNFEITFLFSFYLHMTTYT